MSEAEKILAKVEDQLKKVTASTYTMDPPVRSIFAPENLDPVVKILVPQTAPVRNILPRKRGYGQAAGWNKVTSRLDPQAGGTGTRLGFADAGTPNETTHTTAFVTAAYKNIGRDVTVGRQLIASNRNSNIEDVRTALERLKMVEVLLGEEDITLNGDVATQANEYDGFAKSFTTNSGSLSLLTASGVGVGARTLYNAGSERPTHLVANPRQCQALADDLQGTGTIQRITVDNQGAATGGVRLAQIVNPVAGNLIEVVPSRYCGAWAYLLTVKDVSGENWLEMEDLEPMQVYDVPNTTHAVQSRVFETTVLKVIGEPFQQKWGGLATS